MDILIQLGHGFVNCLTPINLILLTAGIVIGLLIGVLPGLTLVMGVALALPFTYKMDVTASIILLGAMYVSGTYGGAFTAILFRIPGEPIDVPMLWDGYTMGRKGQPAKALGWTLVAALGGGLLSAIVMVALTEPLAKFALRFSSPEYFVIVMFGLLSVVAIGKGSLANAFISMSVGILIATVGVDPIYGAERFTFGSPILADGIEFLVVMVGAYGVGEVLTRLETGFSTQPIQKIKNARTELPTWKEFKEVKGMFFRASVIGDLIGLLPGAGATIASFVSYGIEAKFGKKKHLMGTGVAEGIIAPQAAATASVGGALVHLLALGIPGSGATAVILGAFMLHGIQPGPQVLVTSAPMVYTIFASIFLGILLMCAIGYLAIRPLIKILDFPEAVVSAYVLILCFIGALSIRNNVTDLWLIIAFGVIGYGFERLKFPVAPLVLGVILGPIAEDSFMNTMISFGNDWTVFFTRPISGSIVAFTTIVILLPFIQKLWVRLVTAPQTAGRK
ncbi:MAG: tripartite tricarboxylate transporter permease [Rhizobiales bacterium]|nr:tripartite tricarboxylate transporter permease [Hyphomicrobiales bacterium]